MAKFCATTVLDAALHVITANAIKLVVAKGAPTDSSSTGVGECLSTGADATSLQLAMSVLTSATGAATDFEIENSSVSGRKVTISEQTTIAVTATGVASHIILMSSVTNLIYYYTTCTTQVLGSTANKVTVPAWSIHFYDAT